MFNPKPQYRVCVGGGAFAIALMRLYMVRMCWGTP